MDALDYFGIIFCGLVLIGAIFCSFYLYVKFSHPMDTDYVGVWFTRIVIIAGLTCAFMMVFILPIDLLSTYKERNMPFGFNFDMQYIWTFICMIVIILFFLNNILYTYYKNKELDKLIQRIVVSLKFHIIIIIVYFILSTIIYIYMGKVNFEKILLMNENTLFRYSDIWGLEYNDYSDSRKISYSSNASFMLALLAPLVLIGSCGFSVFGGMGMAFYPLSLIKSYFNRPTRPNAEEQVLARRILLESNNMLIEKLKVTYEDQEDLNVNPNIHPMAKKAKQETIKEGIQSMKTELTSFEGLYLTFKIQDNITASNPLVYTLSLVAGICFLIISLIFMVHTLLVTQGFFIVLEMFFGITESLNIFFSLFVFMITSIYVGLAIIKGCFLVAEKFSSLIPVPPFKLNATWTNSFLFTNNALLVSFLGMIMFFMSYSPTYFRFLAAELIFNQIITNISLCKMLYGFKIFEYLFLLFFMAGLFAAFFQKSPKEILMAKVEEKRVELEQEQKNLEKLEEEKKKEEEKT